MRGSVKTADFKRLVLERGYRKKRGMSGRHIAIDTWLRALDLMNYEPLFSAYGGVEDLLYATEAEIRDLGLKNGAHRAKVVSSLRILREKYERGKSPGLPGNGTWGVQQPLSPNSPTFPTSAELSPLFACSEKLRHDLQRELNSDPSELQSSAWYHGAISRQRAESLVSRPGDFLVRDSISKPGDFVLTCAGCKGTQPLHFIINAVMGACPPGSLPSITFRFEEEAFNSVQELIHHYVSRHKPVTLASGAVLRNPVARELPLSYYDCKYGYADGREDEGGCYSSSPAYGPSPFSTPTHTPTPSPGLHRRAAGWAGSQPVLSLQEDHPDRSRSPSLERFGSLPVINVIPPGGPEHVRRPTPPREVVQAAPMKSSHRAGSEPVLVNNADINSRSLSCSEDLTPTGSQHDLSLSPSPSGFSQRKPSRTESRVCRLPNSRSVPFPVPENIPFPLPSVSSSAPPTPAGRENGVSISPHFPCSSPPIPPTPHHDVSPTLLPSHSAPATPTKPQCRLPSSSCPSSLTSTQSDSSLSRPPPPKPCRVPSFKYKHRPTVQIRNQQLYEDDGRDYTDVHQLSGPPSWAEDSDSVFSPSPAFPSVSKSRSFHHNSRTKEMEKGQWNNLHKGYQTMPHKSRLHRHRSRVSPPPTCSQRSSRDIHGDNRQVDASRSSRPFTLPGPTAMAPRISVDAFQSCIFPAAHNRLLDSGVLLHTKALLLATSARDLAAHITRADLRVWRVNEEDELDLGLGVTSGIELCTLPQGEQLRNDVIERSECQRLWVMTSLLTCTILAERAQLLSLWIEVAGELHVAMGNLFAFASVMEALTSSQVQRLKDTWLTLRQHHTPSAFLFDTSLRPLLRNLRHHGHPPSTPPSQPLTLPYLTPALRLLQECLGEEPDSGSHFHRLLNSWQPTDLQQSLDVVLNHLNNARSMAAWQSCAFSSSARQVLADLPDNQKTDTAGQEKAVRERQEDVEDLEDKENETEEQENIDEVKNNQHSFSDVKEITDCDANLEDDVVNGFKENHTLTQRTEDLDEIDQQTLPEELEENQEIIPDDLKSQEGGPGVQEKTGNLKENYSEMQEKVEHLKDAKKECSTVQEKDCSGMQDEAVSAVRNENVSTELAELFRTEFQLRLLWGSQGIGVSRVQRVNKFEQLLTLLSGRLEPSGKNGTEV